MKTAFRILGIITFVVVIGFLMTTCGGGEGGGYEHEYVFEETSGRLTIINIDPKYEGKYVLAEQWFPSAYGITTTYDLYAGDNFSFVDDGTDEYRFFIRVDTGGKITSGSVTLKVWKTTRYFVNGRNDFYNYIGNDKNLYFFLYIFDKQSITEKDWENKTYKATGYNPPGIGAGIDFTNGIASFDATGRISDY